MAYFQAQLRACLYYGGRRNKTMMKYMAMNKHLGKNFTRIFTDLQSALDYTTTEGGANQVWEVADDGRVWFAMSYPNQPPHWAVSRQSFCQFAELQLANDYYIDARGRAHGRKQGGEIV